MSTREICASTIEELSARIRRREVSPVEATEAVLARIAALNPKVNAFTTVCADDARVAAQAAEREILAGQYRGPLHGIPVGVKDLYDTAGIRTTYGSGMFKAHVPTIDAAIVTKLKAAGAVIVGKTATHEWGLGVTTDNFFFGPTRNPWNLDHVPGGSSGGSGAALAADMCIAATGSDGGGSIRFPAVFNGVFGIKSTLGLISNRGEFGEAGSSFAVPGPMAKTLRDTAIMLQAVAGFDPGYPWSADVPVPNYLAALAGDVAGTRVAVSPDFFAVPVDADVRAAYDAALRQLEALGCTLVEVRMPHHDLIVPTLFTVMGGEGATMHRQLTRERTPEYSPEVQSMIELALGFTIDDFVRAQAARALLRRDYELAFQRADVMVLPTAPVPAPRIGENVLVANGQEHLIAQLCCTFTAGANLTGLPAVPVPAGLSRNRLPVGIQFVAPWFEETRALRVANAYVEAAPELRRLRSPLAA